MPESKKRKPAKRPNPNKAVPRKSLGLGADPAPARGKPKKISRNPAKPLTEEQLYKATDLPEPASYDQVLVHLARMDPVIQEVMIAQRLAAMPHPGDPENGMPVHIERMVRGPWAHHLRKLGIFCFPELATHELIAPDRATGTMVNHTAMTAKKITQDDLWDIARKQNPELAHMVDTADTPEKKQEAAQLLLKKLPVEVRLAMNRLMSHTDEELALS